MKLNKVYRNFISGVYLILNVFIVALCAPTNEITELNLDVDTSKFLSIDSSVFEGFVDAQIEKELIEFDADIDKDLDVYIIKFKNSILNELTLRRPATPIFGNGLVYKEIDLNENGEAVFIDKTPEYQEIMNVQENIYVDPKNDAVLKISEDEDFISLEGIVNQFRIQKDSDDNHFMIYPSKSERKRRDAQGESGNSTNGNSTTNDYIVINRTLAYASGRSIGEITTASPELAYVLDYENSKHFNWDTKKILDYVSVLTNFLNNRFSTTPDPQVVCSVTGVYATKTPEVQAYFEKAKVAGSNNYDVHALLSEFGLWAYENIKSFEPHDILPMLTTLTFDQNLGGMAYLGGACTIDETLKKNSKVAVSTDRNGIWEGSSVVIHEIGHSLGAKHDGDDDPDAKDCPFSAGYIMTYTGWGEANKFRFSTCSQKLMKKFIDSSGGTCLKKQEGKNIGSTKDSMGKRMQMKKLCEIKFPKSKPEVEDADPDVLCRQLLCTFQETGNDSKVQTFHEKVPYLIGDDAKCGKGDKGKCKDGFCIGNDKKPTSKKELDKICKKKSKDSKAVSAPNTKMTPDEQCTQVKCKWAAPSDTKVKGKGKKGKMKITKSFTTWLGNDFPCGKKGKCKDGKCTG